METSAGGSLIIERVRADNFRHLLRLIDGLARFERLSPPDAAARRRLRRHVLSENPKCEAFLGRLGSRYVAYVIFYLTYSSFRARPTLYLEDIFVEEDVRKRGIGQAIFGFCVRRAREAGCGRVEFTVLDWNKAAQRFYEKAGAKRTRWEFYRLDLLRKLPASSKRSNSRRRD